jgi:CDP-diacylglycerol--serine O-phosphatidyltransferase
VKKVYLLPNLFTTASLFCGMLAVTKIFQEQMTEACWLVLASAVLDAMDGKIARLTRTESAFGVNYDSLTDLVAFGVAPALLMYSVLSDEGSMKIASGVTTLYAICGALRLARFNVQHTREERKAFTGLPVPAAAGTVVAAYLVYERIAPVSDVPAKLLPFLVVTLACLMVSKVPYPSHKNVDIERRKPFDYLVSIILAVCALLALREFIEYLLLAAFGAYVGFGAGRALYLAVQRRRQAFARGRADGSEREAEPRESMPFRS